MLKKLDINHRFLISKPKDGKPTVLVFTPYGLFSFHEYPRQIQRQLGEDEKKDDAQDKRNEKRINALVDNVHRDLRDVLYHEHAHCDRRDDGTHADRQRYHDACPDRVIVHVDYCWVKYRGRHDHEGKVVDERSSDKINDEDQAHYYVTVKR